VTISGERAEYAAAHAARQATEQGARPEYAVMGDWLVVLTGPGDCKGCSGILSPAHEPGCGIEPVMQISEVERRVKAYGAAVEVLTGGEYKCFWNWQGAKPLVEALDEALGIARPEPPLTHYAQAGGKARCGATGPVQFASDYTCRDC